MEPDPEQKISIAKIRKLREWAVHSREYLSSEDSESGSTIDNMGNAFRSGRALATGFIALSVHGLSLLFGLLIIYRG
jgi:hypothetical protein